MTLAKPLRAVRNNNPGNLRIGVPWRGLMPRENMNPDQLAETEFCVFSAPVWGFRAQATDLHTKWAADGLKTIRAIVSKYAPPEENDTEAYIANVSRGMGVAADAALDLRNQQQLAAMCKAMACQETDGSWHWFEADLTRGVILALNLTT